MLERAKLQAGICGAPQCSKVAWASPLKGQKAEGCPRSTQGSTASATRQEKDASSALTPVHIERKDDAAIGSDSQRVLIKAAPHHIVAEVITTEEWTRIGW